MPRLFFSERIVVLASVFFFIHVIFHTTVLWFADLSATILTQSDTNEEDRRRPGSKQSYLHTLLFTAFAAIICVISVAVIWYVMRHRSTPDVQQIHQTF